MRALRPHPLANPIMDAGPYVLRLCQDTLAFALVLKQNTFKRADLLHVFAPLPVCPQSTRHIHQAGGYSTGSPFSSPLIPIPFSIIPLLGPQELVDATSSSVPSSFVISDGRPLSALTYLYQPGIRTPVHMVLHTSRPHNYFLDTG
jgi:hypothetical protein